MTTFRNEHKLTAIASAVSLALLHSAQANAAKVEFDEVGPNSGSDIYTSPAIHVDGVSQAISFMELFRTGDEDNGETYGLMKDHLGDPAVAEDGLTPYICSGNTDGVSGSGTDYTALLEKNGKTYMITQFECQTGGMYYAEVVQSPAGELSPVEDTLKFIDQSDEWGGWVHCAGSVTPWNSYLGGEEYEPDAKALEGAAYPTGDRYDDKVRSYWLEDISLSSPYHNGWITEVDIDENGDASYEKHYAMGRFSHELGYVMPDGKTVYLTDDGTNDILFMFVAKNAGDLSDGTLYAAHWLQTSGFGGGSAQLEWINLGKVKSSKIRKAIADDVQFSDLFSVDTADCTTIAANGNVECLEVNPGKELLASRLESRRFAALMGATHEFRKMEGFTFAAERNQGYIAISEVGRGMLDNTGDPDKDDKNYDDLEGDGVAETGNHVRVTKPDYCGAIYSMDMVAGAKDSDGKKIDSTLVAHNMNSILASGTTDGEISPEACAGKDANDEEHNNIMAQPDNITMIPDSDALIIGEDGKHPNNMVWSMNLDSRELTRIATVPEGAETTSPYLHKVGESHYMTLVAQHPDSSGGNPDGDSITGVVGPIELPEEE